MPELPEVELAKRLLERRVVGRPIGDVLAIDARITRPRSVAETQEQLVGLTFERVERVGKNIFLSGTEPGGGTLDAWLHLGMTGQLVVDERSTPLAKDARLALRFDAYRVSLVDARRLARFVVGTSAAVRREAHLDELGPDALGLASSRASFVSRLRAARAQRTIKDTLMDQAVLAGVGNIHALEASYFAGVLPSRTVESLDDEALDRVRSGLSRSFDAVLAEDPEALVYVNRRRAGADAKNPFAVYGREGEPCGVCSTVIVRTKEKGRSSYACPTCQR